jgi:hypothetical protein
MGDSAGARNMLLDCILNELEPSRSQKEWLKDAKGQSQRLQHWI